MKDRPDFPFDLTGYACFSAINCPVEQALRLLEEYPGLSAKENPAPFLFRAALLPELPDWTLIRWPQPGQFYDLLNLTMWLMGYSGCPGGENPIFLALPPSGREKGLLLARPDYDNPWGDSMLGIWQGWSFEFKLSGGGLRWIGQDVFPNDYFFYGRGYSQTGFRLEWVDKLERIPAWTEITLELEA